MGKGGHNTPSSGNHEQNVDTSSLPTQHRLPTLTEIKVKIPAHCFRPTVAQSMSYVVKDIVFVAITYFIMYQIEKLSTYGYLFFPLYWCIQGMLSLFYNGIFL